MTQFSVPADVELKYGDSCPDTQTLAVWDLKYKYQNYVIFNALHISLCVGNNKIIYISKKL